MKTSELTGVALNWAVAKCEGKAFETVESFIAYHDGGEMRFSTNWSQGGPIIERERIQTTPRGETTDLWEAIVFDNIFMDDGSDCFQAGPTPLIAAMRCYVAYYLGDAVDIPQELTNDNS